MVPGGVWVRGYTLPFTCVSITSVLLATIIYSVLAMVYRCVFVAVVDLRCLALERRTGFLNILTW